MRKKTIVCREGNAWREYAPLDACRRGLGSTVPTCDTTCKAGAKVVQEGEVGLLCDSRLGREPTERLGEYNADEMCTSVVRETGVHPSLAFLRLRCFLPLYQGQRTDVGGSVSKVEDDTAGVPFSSATDIADQDFAVSLEVKRWVVL